MLPDTTTPAMRVAANFSAHAGIFSDPHRFVYARPHRILICRPNARLGNTLLITPLVQEIERTWPGAEIDILCACPVAPEIFREFSCVRMIHQLPHRGMLHPIRVVRTLLRARRITYDLIIDPCPRSRSSRLVTRLMRSAVKLGFLSKTKRGGIDIDVDANAAPRHMGIYPVHLLRSALWSPDDVALDAPPPSVALTKTEKKDGLRKLRQLIRDASSHPTDYPIVAVALNATGTKRIEPEWWRRMLRDLFAQCRVRIVEILPLSANAFLREYPGYYSSDVRRIAAVIDAADCFISADSGLMHLGAATTTPTIGLFKCTDPAMYAAYTHGGCGIRIDLHSTAQIAGEIARRIRSRVARASQTEAEELDADAASSDIAQPDQETASRPLTTQSFASV